MNFLVPVMMWGWIPLTIFLFRRFTPQKAVLISVIGGVLFLPVTSYDLPMIEYNKITAISISLACGMIFSRKITEQTFRPSMIDMPIFIWCIITPFISILANGLGPYNAVADVLQISLMWGVFYMAGRVYFYDKDTLRLLCKGIIIGGIIYIPLVFFEIRMSPQLSNIVYGFFPHSWFQHIRYGGYRPIVFMNHGLMVAMWMASTYTVSLWLFGTREITKIKKIPMTLPVILLLLSTILCKSANGWVYLSLGTVGYYFYIKRKSKIIFKLIILAIPIYIILRITAILPSETILYYLSTIFDAHRIESLAVRLFQEELFGRRALESPLWGWGWANRAWPMDPFTGEPAVQMIDSLYLVVFSLKGYIGLVSIYTVLLLGPWKIMKSSIDSVDAIVLSIIVIFFAIDSLMNGMINPVYFLTAGALITVSDNFKYDKLSNSGV